MLSVLVSVHCIHKVALNGYNALNINWRQKVQSANDIADDILLLIFWHCVDVHDATRISEQIITLFCIYHNPTQFDPLILPI